MKKHTTVSGIGVVQALSLSTKGNGVKIFFKLYSSIPKKYDDINKTPFDKNNPLFKSCEYQMPTKGISRIKVLQGLNNGDTVFYSANEHPTPYGFKLNIIHLDIAQKCDGIESRII